MMVDVDCESRKVWIWECEHEVWIRLVATASDWSLLEPLIHRIVC
jgi:hypothetical protein